MTSPSNAKDRCQHFQTGGPSSATSLYNTRLPLRGAYVLMNLSNSSIQLPTIVSLVLPGTNLGSTSPTHLKPLVLVTHASWQGQAQTLYMLSSSLQNQSSTAPNKPAITTTYRVPLRIAILTSTEHLAETWRAASACRAFNVILEST